jgi:diguanylate cyclase (GGDEF)-like protein
MPPEQQLQPKRVAFKIAFQYVVFGASWILLSDLLLGFVIRNESWRIGFGTMKGWLYVSATGILLYRLTYKPIREVKLYQDRLHYNAYWDGLTGLPNRLALNEDFYNYLTDHPGQSSGLLFLDLDKFKYVNDCLGHTSGDKLVRYIGERFMQRMGDRVRIYRFGGDEFVIWPVVWEGDHTLEKLAESVKEYMREPYILDGSNVYITASIGGARYPTQGGCIDELLRCGDMAMYKAKLEGGNTFASFEPIMNEAYLRRMELEKELRTAMENGEFNMAYQPQYDARNHRVVGFEALLRWNNPSLGAVPPDRFIPVAEDTRLIIPIGEWVLRNACFFVSRLRENTGLELGISVNISMLQIVQDNFVDSIEQAIRDSALPPEALELEITESVFMESLDSIKRKIALLRGKGIKVALDDFGKGYSSLNSLVKLPITTIKLDKSFIDSICIDPKYLALTRNIIQIGRTFGLEVVAEGVESEEQAHLLEANDCHLIQGYLFSKPLSESGIQQLLDIKPK